MQALFHACYGREASQGTTQVEQDYGPVHFAGDWGQGILLTSWMKVLHPEQEKAQASAIQRETGREEDEERNGRVTLRDHVNQLLSVLARAPACLQLMKMLSLWQPALSAQLFCAWSALHQHTWPASAL